MDHIKATLKKVRFKRRFKSTKGFCIPNLRGQGIPQFRSQRRKNTITLFVLLALWSPLVYKYLIVLYFNGSALHAVVL